MGSCGQQCAATEQVEAGASIGLTLEQLQPGDLSFDCPLLQGVVSAARTAAPSCFRPAANVTIALILLVVASASHFRKVARGARAFRPTTAAYEIDETPYQGNSGRHVRVLLYPSECCLVSGGEGVHRLHEQPCELPR